MNLIKYILHLKIISRVASISKLAFETVLYVVVTYYFILASII